jgi:lipopolysaccharide/colanic/teichoic acid biosynthesis glycosyltransferase
LAVLTGDQSSIGPAERLIAQVAATQNTKKRLAVDYGGVAGSYPIYGASAPLQYPNWAAKFMVDALLVRKQWHQGKKTLADRDLWSG